MQKTAYEMRMSDWSSDVCSSDLHGAGELAFGALDGHVEFDLAAFEPGDLFGELVVAAGVGADGLAAGVPRHLGPAPRGGGRVGHSSEVRRVGQECVRTCRSRLWRYISRKTNNKPVEHRIE